MKRIIVVYAVLLAPLAAVLMPLVSFGATGASPTTPWYEHALVGMEVGPAVLINFVGKGAVLTFASSPDFAAASEHHIVEARKLFANAVRLLQPTPRVRISAPANVEAVVTDDPATRTLRVHLIAYNATPQPTPAKDRPYVLPGLIEDAPMFRASLEFPGGLKSARALNRTTRLKKRGQRVELVVEDIHDVIQCRY
jgi:hypothetical protein